MLYHIYEAQRSLLEPFADFAQATAKLYSNPLLPLSKSFTTQRTVAAFDLFYRLAERAAAEAQAKLDWLEGRFGQVPDETEFIPLPER